MRITEVDHRRPDARRRVISFCDGVAEMHGHGILSDHLRLELEDPSTDPAPILVVGLDDHDGIRGMAQASVANGARVVELVLPGTHESPPDASLAESLIRAVIGAADPSDGELIWWIRSHDRWYAEVAQSLGFDERRRLLQLRFTAGVDDRDRLAGLSVVTRAFRVGHDDEEWLAVNNAAFAGHGEQGSWDESTLARRLASEWFDPEGFLLHEDDDGLAGFCWTKVHPPTGHDGALGEIYVIAVEPGRAGRGLGTALTASGLVHLIDLGLREVMLFVDESNTAARAMYRSLGFTEHHSDSAMGLTL
ncbi:MAG: mycothiol synthase [Ilumatobacteraceae bacterium]